MRSLIGALAVAAALSACSPPAERREAPAPTATTPAEVVSCNDLQPDAARQVRIEDELAVAAAAADLRGGRIAPGLYDLSRAIRIGSATGWSATRAAVLQVAEGPEGGLTFNWASKAEGEARDSWSADFTETPQPRLTYTCGRIGGVEAAFSVERTDLVLRLQDGAAGQLLLTFQPRP